MVTKKREKRKKRNIRFSTINKCRFQCTDTRRYCKGVLRKCVCCKSAFELVWLIRFTRLKYEI